MNRSTLCSILILSLSLGGCDSARVKGAAAQPRAGPTPASATTAITDRRLPANVAVQVGKHSITTRTLALWINLEALIRYEATPMRPAPRGVVPVPPAYRACISYLAARAGTRRARGEAQWRAQCAQQHRTLEQQALERLITHYWVAEEASSASVAVSAREIEHDLKVKFLTTKGLRRYLAFTRLSLADERFIVEGELLPERWQRRTLPVYARLRRSKPPETAQMSAEVDIELTHLIQHITKKWIPRTRCKMAYQTPLCGGPAG